VARTPGSTKDETHSRIVEVAARALRREGLAGTGVAAVMKEAGLTHGGFYAHFGSRDALLIEALAHAGKESGAVVQQAIAERPAGVSPFRALVETYLADVHPGRLDIGCPVAALGCDMPRQPKAVRKASARGVRLLVDAVHRALPSAGDAVCATIAGTLVGGLQLARTLGNTEEGRAHLAAVRSTLLQAHDSPPRRH
jgi:TetR/AcrR family transcriptional regulator, transcriptional repressor for nem operon